MAILQLWGLDKLNHQDITDTFNADIRGNSKHCQNGRFDFEAHSSFNLEYIASHEFYLSIPV